MDRRKVLQGIVLAGTVGVGGCAGGGSSEAPFPEDEVVELSGPPCEAIDGAKFESVKRYGGYNIDSGARRWIRFGDGGYQYSYSDVVESGDYTCTVDDGTAKIEGESSYERIYTGTYDPESGVLEWHDARYRPVETS